MARQIVSEGRPAHAMRRQALGIDQRTMAHILGLSVGYFQQIDRGDRRASPGVKARLAIVLPELEHAQERARARVAELTAS